MGEGAIAYHGKRWVLSSICRTFGHGDAGSHLHASVDGMEWRQCTQGVTSYIAKYLCILVLGCGVWGETPSHMLEDRLLQGIELYENGASEKLLMSGDHGTVEYDEVNAMKDYAIEAGAIPDQVFMDHAGFSTYESMYRARDVFDVDSMIIVTQKYHLYRAVYNARKLGIDAYGIAADGQFKDAKIGNLHIVTETDNPFERLKAEVIKSVTGKTEAEK